VSTSPERSAAVRLYGRPGCHLCDDARQALEDEGIPHTEIDIESDDELMLRYLERIPVVTVGDEVAFELLVDLGRLRQLVTAHGVVHGDH
jgi:glutaredoxin